MKTIVMILVLSLLVQCKTGEFYPPANRYDYIKDSFYYRRDTINFYEVEVNNRLAQSLDSIIESVPLISENHYWTIDLYRKSLRSITGYLYQEHCERVFLGIEDLDCTYKAMRIKGTTVFILDPYDIFRVIPERPFITIQNPRQLKGIYNVMAGQSWLLKIDRKGRLISIEEE